MDIREYSPWDTFSTILSHWWWAVLLALVGGSLGWAIHRLQPPIYEAKAVITVMIDYSQTTPMTEYDQDHAIGIVKAVVLSKEVMEQVEAKAQAQRLSIKALKYGESIYLERKHSVLELIIRSRDPQDAASLANLWAETAYDSLVKAQHSALQARVLRGELVALENCLQLPEASPDRPGLCASYASDELSDRIQNVVFEVGQAETQARGILSIFSFELSQLAESQTQPVAYGVNLLVFSGAMIGLILGLLAISMKWTK